VEQISGPRAYLKSERGAFGNYAVVFGNEVVIQRASIQDAISSDDIAAAMARANANICSHLSTSAIAAVSNLQEQRRHTMKTQEDDCFSRVEVANAQQAVSYWGFEEPYATYDRIAKRYW
jgi:hypothetical protein